MDGANDDQVVVRVEFIVDKVRGYLLCDERDAGRIVDSRRLGS